jgi:uncharacterized membrane protein YjjB (DUF3815 family)
VIKRKYSGAVVATTVAALLAIVPGLSRADVEAELAERQKIVAEVERRLADEEARSKAMEAGLERSTLCGA